MLRHLLPRSCSLRMCRRLWQVQFPLQAGYQDAQEIFPLFLGRHFPDVVLFERQGLVTVIWLALVPAGRWFYDRNMEAYQPVTCCMPSFPAEFAPICHGQQFPKTIQEYDVQHTRVHTDRSHKRQPLVAMSLRCALGMSLVCMPRTGWSGNAITSIREGNA